MIIAYKMDYELGENNIEMRKIQGDKNQYFYSFELVYVRKQGKEHDLGCNPISQVSILVVKKLKFLLTKFIKKLGIRFQRQF